MEDILSVLTKDDCFKRSRRGNQQLSAQERPRARLGHGHPGPGMHTLSPAGDKRRASWPSHWLFPGDLRGLGVRIELNSTVHGMGTFGETQSPDQAGASEFFSASVSRPAGSLPKSHAVGPQEIRERATVLQTVFEDYVHSSERTVSGAKKALQSFIRAYAAYPRELKHIFHVRFLHLGHVAKSFGLRDAPKNLSALSVKKKKANLKRPDLQRRTQSRHRLAEILLSEYSSGMETSIAKVKKQSECAGPGSQRPASAVGKNEAQKPY